MDVSERRVIHDAAIEIDRIKEQVEVIANWYKEVEKFLYPTNVLLLVDDAIERAKAIDENQKQLNKLVDPGKLLGLQIQTKESVERDQTEERWIDDIEKIQARAKELLEQGKTEGNQTTVDAVVPAAKRAKVTQATPATPVKPPKITGVSEELCLVCATICVQIYDATAIRNFKLPYGAKVLDFTNHGSLDKFLPAFAIAKFNNCLILAWRASKNIMDWISNLSCTPVSSTYWSKIAPDLQAHSAYTKLVERDLSHHQSVIIKVIKNNKDIEEIIFTGESLGGGMANVAHVIVQSQIDQTFAPWNEEGFKELKCRTMAFAAPMTLSFPESKMEGNPDATGIFLTKVSKNTFNIVYSYDPVPHAFGDSAFVLKAIERTITRASIDKNGVLVGFWIILFGEDKKMMSLLDVWKAILTLHLNYRQIGTILYYRNADADPVALRDCNLVTDLPLFRNHIEIPENVTLHDLVSAHTFFVRALSNTRTTEQETLPTSYFTSRHATRKRTKKKCATM